MKLTNEFLTIKIEQEKVFYNEHEIKYISYENLYEILLRHLKKEKHIQKTQLYLEGEYEPLTNIEQITLLALSNYYINVYSNTYSKYLDISFSYNFQIHIQKWIIDKLLKLGQEPLKTNMIVLVDSLEYCERDVSNNEKYNKFYKKYGYYIRRGDRDFKTEKCGLSYAIDYWNDYCEKKHNKRFNADAVHVYNSIYSNPGFKSIKITCNNETVVTSVYFKDEINRIIYYLITGWNEKYKKYSPCIYLYSKAIQYCHNNNYNFSFCYGNQTYKKNLLKCFGDKNE